MPFDYWYLPKSNNVTTKIVRCYKSGKYIVFVRDDGKECKYDLSSGEVIGFRGKLVKRLNSQLKDLTCKRLFQITKDPIYRKYFEWVWKWHPNGKAWVFFEYTMPKYKEHEQFFTSGFTNLQSRFKYGYNDVPKGLLKLCNEYSLMLTNVLFEEYKHYPDAFNIIPNLNIAKCTPEDMIKAMTFGHDAKWRDRIKGANVNPNNLVQTGDVPMNRLGEYSYFGLLIKDLGYNAKLLITYVDSVKIGCKFKKEIFRDIYDYADMMMQMYDSYDRYPEDFRNAHQRASEEYNRITKTYNDEKYGTRNVLEYECEIDGFRFIYPRKTEDIKSEGKNQHNCVATYINRVLDGACHIMFMRPVDNVEESYITLEIRNNKIVQAKRKYNNSPSDEEKEIIKKWNEKYKDFIMRIT